MKVIVSHDIDHLYSTEHLLDGILVKYGVRAVMELMNGVLSVSEFKMRFGDLFHKQWHHIDELMDFDEANGIPSTFFFAMAKGKSLNYSQHAVIPVIQRVLSRGFDCGVHGIGFENQEKIDAEFQRFRSLTGQSTFGIRMHYLQRNQATWERLSHAGYLFDSSDFTELVPYLKGNMWEFPLYIMDSQHFYKGKSHQTEKAELIIKQTKIRIDQLAAENHQYLTLLFHDRYFCDAYHSYQNWYERIIRYLQENGYEFIDYRSAIGELSYKQLS